MVILWDVNENQGWLPEAQSLHMFSRVGLFSYRQKVCLPSSSGIGWTSWKKRWFILTRTSLVFFRSDPSIAPQKGSEVNLTLGGIDLNNSGSVVVRADKKLLTVLFPDGRDGRAFTLKAETTEDLYEWKVALENALAQAPSPTLVVGQNGIFRSDPDDGASEQLNDKRPSKSMIVGRPILLALEETDGTPSFLEKALRFIEDHGVKVEGILRQAADVDDVECRMKEYEKGKVEFSSEEDAHVIGDCVKYVLRELPSSPVPAACCNALLDAFRVERGLRVDAMREAIYNTFPEPNRHLLQRILKMMQIVASHKSENRMSLSAVAACMAPLLLRPLLAGECDLGSDFSMGGDGSVQLMQAAAAANHAQAIVIILLEEYDNIFDDNQLQDGSSSPELYSDMEESGSEGEEQSVDDDGTGEDDESQHELDEDAEGDPEHARSETCSESSGNGDGDLHEDKVSEGFDIDSESSQVNENAKANQIQPSNGPQASLSQNDNVHSDNLQSQSNTSSVIHADESSKPFGDNPATSAVNQQNERMNSTKHQAIWGRIPAKRNAPMEPVDLSNEDKVAIQRLEVEKTDLQNRISKEAKENVVLQESLEKQKTALRERRVALEKDVARLQEQLQRERDLRATLEAGLNMPMDHLNILAIVDEKTKADLEEIATAEADIINLKQKVADLNVQLHQQRNQNYGSVNGSCHQQQPTPDNQGTLTEKQNKVEMRETEFLHERSTRSEGLNLDKTISSNKRTQELPSSINKQLPLSNTQSVGVPASSSSVEPQVVGNVVSSDPKKSSTKSEDVNLVAAHSDNTRTQDPPSLSNKQPPQKHQVDSSSQNSIKALGASALSTMNPMVAGAISSLNIKKISAKAEGAVAASSALTKLTTRLNFLKERRIQIAKELQSLGEGSEGQSHGLHSRTKSR
ncbi:PREDICTED: rho GTPase-activating protein REN1-like isoform X2 [Nelumbo nucifera]|uniref:Rho GTPase-activating protein REN1-like isoform X2 n=1 Tax=Nelumbo nucifera TaxID=4432 RepID=A0A1U8ATK9_NELNU|nr:PREDICTED: rho GTPase-activating protein REN1-like isoform X2 [Nelumbo nucifera]